MQRSVTESDEMYQKVEKEAFANLFHFIRSDIIPNNRIVPFYFLTTKLESFVQSEGVTLKESTKKQLRRSLETEFQDSVLIFSDDYGKLLMVPEGVSLQSVIIENQIMCKELSVWKSKSSHINKIIDQASSHIRSAIKEEAAPTPWPIHPYDIANCGFISIPSHLERFLVGLLTGDPDTKTQSQKTATLVQSFSQDIIYACIYVTGGQKKPQSMC